MAQQRRVQLSTQRPTSTVCVLGTELSLDVCGSAPKDAVAFHVQGTPGVKLYVVHETQSVKLPSSVCRWPLAAGTEVLLAMDAPSKDVGDEKVRISYFREAGGVPVGRAMLYLTCVEVSLDTDVSRSGAVSRTLLDKATWTWGPDGHGAILLVNCDRDDPKAETLDNQDTAIRSYADLKDMSQMVLRTRGPRTIFAGHRLLLHVDFSDADKVGVFYGGNSIALEEYKHVLGGSKLAYTVKPSRHQEESIFYVEGLAFPDVGFSGLVAFHVTLLESPEKGLLETPIFTDTVVFRVAPWIMTPNTAAPLEVFVCSVDKNEDFVAAVGAMAEKTKCPLTVCPLLENRQDRWIQGPDFGYVARQAPEGASSLDSFGNLEVSPPVTVQGKEYPLGRILIGSSFPRFGGRRMAKAVKDFLVAQQVQAPVELFSDWLLVGHVDEFLSFVPAPDRKGFRLLLASPSACYQLLKEKQEEGFGEAVMFEGLKEVSKPTINEILANEGLRKFNNYVQVRKGSRGLLSIPPLCPSIPPFFPPFLCSPPFLSLHPPHSSVPRFVQPSFSPSLCPFVHSSTHLSLSPSLCPSLTCPPSLHPSVPPSSHPFLLNLSTHPSVHPSIPLSLPPFVPPSLHPSIHPFLPPSVRPSFHPPLPTPADPSPLPPIRAASTGTETS
uniref:Protein-arginine deiminase n=1 Tax=Accipiter nisus TaxID=211598 RepID=A0A8B9RT44_9AVES